MPTSHAFQPTLLAQVWRGERVESRHFGHWVIVDANGCIVGSGGSPDIPVYLRSSAKPIQALMVVASGAADRFGLTDRELAIACGSHAGSAEHVAAVDSILAKVGVGRDALECGAHWPSDEAMRNQLICQGAHPEPIHNNCSGKHAGMIAAAAALGLQIQGYSRIEHPLQQKILSLVAEVCGQSAEDVGIGIDGCGLPTFSVPLHAAALGFARLASGSGLSAELAAAAQRIVQAMWAAPVMVAARGSVNTDFLAAFRGRAIAKGGAEGLYCIGTTSGLGIAVKTEDGSHRCAGPVIVRLMEIAGEAVPDDFAGRWREVPVRNTKGEVVGRVAAVVE